MRFTWRDYKYNGLIFAALEEQSTTRAEEDIKNTSQDNKKNDIRFFRYGVRDCSQVGLSVYFLRPAIDIETGHWSVGCYLRIL